jgi:hypothetical protein
MFTEGAGNVLLTAHQNSAIISEEKQLPILT